MRAPCVPLSKRLLSGVTSEPWLRDMLEGVAWGLAAAALGGILGAALVIGTILR